MCTVNFVLPVTIIGTKDIIVNKTTKKAQLLPFEAYSLVGITKINHIFINYINSRGNYAKRNK